MSMSIAVLQKHMLPMLVNWQWQLTVSIVVVVIDTWQLTFWQLTLCQIIICNFSEHWDDFGDDPWDDQIIWMFRKITFEMIHDMISSEIISDIISNMLLRMIHKMIFEIILWMFLWAHLSNPLCDLTYHFSDAIYTCISRDHFKLNMPHGSSKEIMNDPC